MERDKLQKSPDPGHNPELTLDLVLLQPEECLLILAHDADISRLFIPPATPVTEKNDKNGQSEGEWCAGE